MAKSEKRKELEKIAASALEWCRKYGYAHVSVFAFCEDAPGEPNYYGAFTSPDDPHQVDLHKFVPKACGKRKSTSEL